MKELADLPPLGIFIFSVVLAVIYYARHFGLLAGKTASNSPSSGATVAAVIVDPEALNRCTKAGELLASRLQDTNKILSDHSATFARRMESLEESFVDFNRSIKDLESEISRTRK